MLAPVSPLLANARRHLNLHEYQSKGVMASKRVRVSHGYMAQTPAEAEAKAEQLLGEGSTKLIVKAQIHAGGRGKGHFNTGLKGGVQFPGTDVKKVGDFAKQMLGSYLITKQTPPTGQICNKILVEEGLHFDKAFPEMYVAFLMDRSSGGPVMVASAKGVWTSKKSHGGAPRPSSRSPSTSTSGCRSASRSRWPVR